MDGALEEVDFFVFAVVDAFKARAIAEGPVDGEGGDAEDGFEFIEEVEGWACGAVQFVHEGEDGDSAPAAYFEEFTGLSLDALTGVYDHDGGVDGGEDAVGIF